MSEPLHVVPATAGLSDEAIAKTQAIRTAARKAVVETQDDKALRLAYSARPRVAENFQPGDMVAYWRYQKYQQGQGVLLGGRWYGTAVVVGRIGKNYIIAHRRQIFRVAPEQLRPATSEERVLVTTANTELLGVKDMLEGGTFKSHQYVDLVPGHYPTLSDNGPTITLSDNSNSDEVAPAPADSSSSASQPAAEPQISAPEPTAPDEPMPEGRAPGPSTESTEPVSSDPDQSNTTNEPSAVVDKGTVEHPEGYGPVRRRMGSKMGAAALYRPAPMRDQDFADMMSEVVPRLLTDAIQKMEVENPNQNASSSSSSHKRPRSEQGEGESPESARPRTLSTEVLSVETLPAQDQLSSEDVAELVDMLDDPSVSIEVLVANYMQKKTSKEIGHSNNHPDLQAMVDESKRTEWNTILDKTAVRIHYGKKATKIKEQYADRFIGSRFVIVRKATEENQPIIEDDPNSYRVKSRWCLQGHLDPDLDKKVEQGLLQSPTLSQLGRMLTMQLIASHGWLLQLGDIKGAFLEAGPLPEKFRPLFASQPAGGVPGLPKEAVIEVLGNVYGQNDAPLAWHSTFDKEAIAIGWERSKFDACLYFLRDSTGLCGVMGVHVDDTAVGGSGKKFEQAIQDLRSRFPYRKWRCGEGEFCGAYYTQDPKTKSISLSQKLFAEKMRPATIPKNAGSEDLLNDNQIKILRAINGSLNWIASQSRPDLAVQTSMLQQSFPHPRIKHLRDANNAIRRAKLHKDLTITFQPISPKDLCVCCHSDAAFANVGAHTQAGYVLAFVNKAIHSGEVSSWTPVAWKSYKLPRAVSSTLGGESQALATASGTAEWLNLLLSEALDGSFEARTSRSVLARRPSILATDCKSLYDHLVSPSSPTAVDDRRTSIDIVIIRESIKVMTAQVRWVPTKWMLADGLTKDKIDPVELLRSCVRGGTYQISPEEHVLAQQAAERTYRAQNRSAQGEQSGGDRLETQENL